jgi:hypothetical protein
MRGDIAGTVGLLLQHNPNLGMYAITQSRNEDPTFRASHDAFFLPRTGTNDQQVTPQAAARLLRVKLMTWEQYAQVRRIQPGTWPSPRDIMDYLRSIPIPTVRSLENSTAAVVCDVMAPVLLDLVRHPPHNYFPSFPQDEELRSFYSSGCNNILLRLFFDEAQAGNRAKVTVGTLSVSNDPTRINSPKSQYVFMIYPTPSRGAKKIQRTHMVQPLARLSECNRPFVPAVVSSSDGMTFFLKIHTFLFLLS